MCFAQQQHADSKERENAITKEHKTVFIMQIGDKLRSGEPHDSRSPDYDDWQLNGDFPYRGLHLADMCFAQQQHADSGLADAAADGAGQLAFQQHPVVRFAARLRLSLPRSWRTFIRT